MNTAFAIFIAVAYLSGLTWLLHRAEPRSQAWRREARAGLVLAFSYGLVGIEYLLDPLVVQRSAVGEALGPITATFYFLYIVGAVLMLAAFLRGRRDLEGAALVACGTGWALNGLALLAVHPEDVRYGVFAVWTVYVINRLRELAVAAR